MNKRIVIAVVSGFVIGAVWLGAIRFALTEDKTVHYHANFALYINGQRDELKSFTFYEEVASCNANDKNNPKNLVHLHDQKAHLVHIHAEGMTWGALFQNLGYVLGDEVIRTDSGTYTDGMDGNNITFWINGKEASTMANKVIHDKDTLLINYGNDDENTIKQRYEAIPRDAEAANNTADPAACGGGEKWDFKTRLLTSLGLK